MDHALGMGLAHGLTDPQDQAPRARLRPVALVLGQLVEDLLVGFASGEASS